jgi:hypothetical protein
MLFGEVKPTIFYPLGLLVGRFIYLFEIGSFVPCPNVVVHGYMGSFQLIKLNLVCGKACVGRGQIIERMVLVVGSSKTQAMGTTSKRT